MILDLDVGNTRLKWRTVSAQGIVGTSSANALADADMFAGISSEDVARVRVSCVAGRHNENLITTWCERELGVPLGANVNWALHRNLHVANQGWDG